MYQHKNNDFTQFELGINLFYNEDWFVWKPPSINRKNLSVVGMYAHRL